ncbi:MAG: sulfatase [Planctomycetota bacterium]
MNRRQFLKTGGALVSGLAAIRPILGQDNQAKKRPDILFIAIEDVSPHRFGCYGGKVAKTPNMDRFAAGGIRFAETHTNPPCCPSRTALFLGLRPDTTKVYGNNDNWAELCPDALSMPEHLRNNGYETIRCGKMFHGGSGSGAFERDACWSKIVNPSEGMPERKKTRRPAEGPGVEYAKERKQAQKKGKAKSHGSPFIYGPTGLAGEEELDGMVASQGIRLLNEKQDKPILLALGMHATHLPFCCPDKYFEMYPWQEMQIPRNPDAGPDGMPKDPKVLSQQNPYTIEQWKKAIAGHYACLSFVDAQIGRVLDALEKSGRKENTIVVIWSDHGFMLGEHFMWRKGPLRDESTMSALLMQAPGVTKAGSVCKRPVETIDIFPTIFDVCGVSQPEGIEAMSMRRLLETPGAPWKKGALMHGGRKGRSICTEKWRYNEYEGAPDQTELFDQAADPGEFANLAQDPKHTETVKELSAFLRGGWKACLPEGT